MGEDGHAPRVHDVHGPEEDVAAGLGDARRRGVGVVGGDVDRPHRRLVPVLHWRQPGDVAAPQREHRVAAGLLGRAGVLRLPAEEAGVEAPGGVDVGAGEVDPARHAGLVGGAFAHGADGPSLRRNGTTVCRKRLRSGAAVSGSRWLSVADASTSTERAARDLRAGDEAPGAAQDAAVGQVGLQRVERQVDRPAVPRAQLQVVGLRVARQRVGRVDVDAELGREVPLARVGGLLAEGLRQALDRRDLAVDPVAVGTERAGLDVDERERRGRGRGVERVAEEAAVGGRDRRLELRRQQREGLRDRRARSAPSARPARRPR